MRTLAFLFVFGLLLSSASFAAKKQPTVPKAATDQEKLEEVTGLSGVLEEARVPPKGKGTEPKQEDFKEDLQLSVSSESLPLQELPLAPSQDEK
ncbi:MAG TPA: hypothetical protein VIH99_05255 [Bdellovibrionota bacterium]|jgi:hypothetical protein